MDKKQLFKHYMLAGHGRTFKLLDGCEEEFREIVLYGCLNDISCDTQCEGSRGIFLYDLVLQYEDYEYFLIPAIEKFLSDEVNADWSLICQLCDFINCFADDDGVESAQNAIDRKYVELYSLIMSMKFGARAKKVIQCYEYLAIIIMQRGEFDRTLQILKDMGAYFIRRRRTEDIELQGLFLWFSELLKDEYGESFLETQLEENGRHSKEIARFKRVMTAPDRKGTDARFKIPTADDLIEKAKTSTISKRDSLRFGKKADDSEKLRLAEAVLAEENLNKKANLLSAFTKYNVFPMNAQYLIRYAESENQRLRDTALAALVPIKADCVHDFAMELLQTRFAGESVSESRAFTRALDMLIRNYREDDKEFILNQLEKITIDQDDSSGWHDLIMDILLIAHETRFPDEFYTFIYEKSRCSSCRESAIEELRNRNLLTEEMISECMWDCRMDIRAEVEKV